MKNVPSLFNMGLSIKYSSFFYNHTDLLLKIHCNTSLDVSEY